MQNFDIVIVGGAMTGSILALALSSATQHRIRIAIIEKQRQTDHQQGGFDSRSIALAQGSLQKLSQIQPLVGANLAEVIAPILTPIHHIEVSDQFHFGKTYLNAKEMRLPQLGAVVELRKIGQKLSQIMANQPNIRLFCPDFVEKIIRTPQHCQLYLSQGETLITSLMIAADGIQSQLAKQCGIATMCLEDYQQSAVIANVKIAQPHQNRAFERFTTQGPLALLPLSDNTMSLVWCVNDADKWLSMRDATFLHALQQAFGWHLGKFLATSHRVAYPLLSQKASQHIHHRLAIVGNAAQLLHPVAGQGFNLGMRDIFDLTQLIVPAFLSHTDIGDYALLTKFEQKRQSDQTHIIHRTSSLISFFCCDHPLSILGRNIALMSVAHSKLLRNWIANQALGW